MVRSPWPKRHLAKKGYCSPAICPPHLSASWSSAQVAPLFLTHAHLEGPHPWHREFPGPGMKPETWQWQYQILNQMSHQGTHFSSNVIKIYYVFYNRRTPGKYFLLGKLFQSSNDLKFYLQKYFYKI